MNEQQKRIVVIVVAVVAVAGALASLLIFAGPQKEEVIGALPGGGKAAEMSGQADPAATAGAETGAPAAGRPDGSGMEGVTPAPGAGQ